MKHTAERLNDERCMGRSLVNWSKDESMQQIKYTSSPTNFCTRPSALTVLNRTTHSFYSQFKSL